MNKPASELIALADFLAQQNSYHSNSIAARDPIIVQHINELKQWEDTVRHLAVKSGRLRDACQPFIDALASIDGDTPVALRCDDDTNIGAAIWDYSQPTVGHLRKLAAALATPPAQPAPASDTITGAQMDAIEQAAIAGKPLSELPSDHGKPDGAVRVLSRDWKTIEEQIGAAQGDDLLALLRDYLVINSAPGNDLAPLYIARIDAALSSKIAAAETSPGVIDAVIAELMDRRLLNDVGDDLHQEIAMSLIKVVHG